MKGIILAGGQGSRLSPLTDITNKFLMPVYDKLMIEYSVLSLTSAGITEICIVLGTKSAGETIDYLKSGRKYGAKFTYVYQDTPRGVADALKQAQHFAGDDDIIVLCADNIIYDNLLPFINDFKGGCFITTKRFADPEELKRFAVLDLKKNGRLVEKPYFPPSNTAFCGIQIYDKTVWPIIDELKLSPRGEFEIVDVINYYADNFELDFKELKKPWFDCGTKDALFGAQEYAYYLNNTVLEENDHI